MHISQLFEHIIVVLFCLDTKISRLGPAAITYIWLCVVWAKVFLFQLFWMSVKNRPRETGLNAIPPFYSYSIFTSVGAMMMTTATTTAAANKHNKNNNNSNNNNNESSSRNEGRYIYVRVFFKYVAVDVLHTPPAVCHSAVHGMCWYVCVCTCNYYFIQ